MDPSHEQQRQHRRPGADAHRSTHPQRADPPQSSIPRMPTRISNPRQQTDWSIGKRADERKAALSARAAALTKGLLNQHLRPGFMGCSDPTGLAPPPSDKHSVQAPETTATKATPPAKRQW